MPLKSVALHWELAESEPSFPVHSVGLLVEHLEVLVVNGAEAVSLDLGLVVPALAGYDDEAREIPTALLDEIDYDEPPTTVAGLGTGWRWRSLPVHLLAARTLQLAPFASMRIGLPGRPRLLYVPNSSAAGARLTDRLKTDVAAESEERGALRGLVGFGAALHVAESGGPASWYQVTGRYTASRARAWTIDERRTEPLAPDARPRVYWRTLPLFG